MPQDVGLACSMFNEATALSNTWSRSQCHQDKDLGLVTSLPRGTQRMPDPLLGLVPRTVAPACQKAG